MQLSQNNLWDLLPQHEKNKKMNDLFLKKNTHKQVLYPQVSKSETDGFEKTSRPVKDWDKISHNYGA